MKIIIVSNNQQLYTETCNLFKENKNFSILYCKFDYIKYFLNQEINLIIIEFERKKVFYGEFQIIFEIRCKIKTPILVILE